MKGREMESSSGLSRRVQSLRGSLHLYKTPDKAQGPLKKHGVLKGDIMTAAEGQRERTLKMLCSRPGGWRKGPLEAGQRRNASLLEPPEGKGPADDFSPGRLTLGFWISALSKDKCVCLEPLCLFLPSAPLVNRYKTLVTCHVLPKASTRIHSFTPYHDAGTNPCYRWGN